MAAIGSPETYVPFSAKPSTNVRSTVRSTVGTYIQPRQKGVQASALRTTPHIRQPWYTSATSPTRIYKACTLKLTQVLISDFSNAQWLLALPLHDSHPAHSPNQLPLTSALLGPWRNPFKFPSASSSSSLLYRISLVPRQGVSASKYDRRFFWIKPKKRLDSNTRG